MTKKYKLTTETKEINGHTVYRIRALKGFDTIIGRMVNKGDLGGWVESEANLSHDGNCWLFDDAAGYENSRRTENSVGYGNSRQYGDSRQYGSSRQFGNSKQYGSSQQFGNSLQCGSSRQFGNSKQCGSSRQYGDSRQSGHSQQYGNSAQSGKSQQFGNSRQYGSSRQFGDSCQFGDSRQYGSSRQFGNSKQSGSSQQYGNLIHRNGVDDGTGKLLCIGPCGDTMRTITIQPDNTIVAGCFHGTFDEFKRDVVKKYGKDYGSYAVCIAAIQNAVFYRSEI